MSVKVGTFTLSEKDYDHRDFLLGNILKNLMTLNPPKELMRGISETYRQGTLGSCTAMGTTHSMKSQNEKEYGRKVELSRKDLRAKMGHSITKYDGGDSVENAVKTALKQGIKGELDGNEYLFKSDARGYGKRDTRQQALMILPLITVIYGNDNTRKETLDGEVKTIIGRNAKSLGHAILLAGYDQNYVYFYNSFGDRINKNGISNFKISRSNFEKAISINMINWRYFGLVDQKNLRNYTIEIELSKQAIKPFKKLYDIAEQDVKEQFEKWGITSYLEKRYGFTYKN